MCLIGYLEYTTFGVICVKKLQQMLRLILAGGENENEGIYDMNEN